MISFYKVAHRLKSQPESDIHNKNCFIIPKQIFFFLLSMKVIFLLTLKKDYSYIFWLKYLILCPQWMLNN